MARSRRRRNIGAHSSAGVAAVAAAAAGVLAGAELLEVLHSAPTVRRARPRAAGCFCAGGSRRLRRPALPRAVSRQTEPSPIEVPAWFAEIVGDPEKKIWLKNSITRLGAYDDKMWDRHKAPDRFQRHFLGFVISSMIQRLGGSLVFLAVCSCLAVVLASPELGAVKLPEFDIDPFNLSATALGLLLTLRVSESYNRFRLSHQHLASISGRLRDSARCLAAGLQPFPERAETLGRCCALLLAVAEAVKCQLRPAGMEDLTACLRSVGLAEEAAARANAAAHPPSAVLAEVTAAVVSLERRGLLDAGLATILQQNLSDVVSEIALLERIKRHPVPLKYTRHTSRIMFSWLALLPLGLVPILGWTTVPTVVGLGFGLLGIEDIAVQIEEPFTIIDIEDINRDLKRSVDELRSTPLEVVLEPWALPLSAWTPPWRGGGPFRRLRRRLGRRGRLQDERAQGFEELMGVQTP